jgi:predicted glutamine amidotransferase
MCIAILNRVNTLSYKTFKQCWNSNPDGAGLTFFDGKNIQIIKEMKSVKNFYTQYKEIRTKYPTIDIAIHFRIATHGGVTLTNCHPFKVNKQTAFIHNGIISKVNATKEFSDTFIFNETILKNLPPNFATNETILELLDSYIGYSKLVIISGKNYAIVNESAGHWNAGNWYSNESYKPRKVYTYTLAPYGTYSKIPNNVNRASWHTPNLWDESEIYAVEKPSKATKSEAKYYSGLCECCSEQSDKLTYSGEYNIDICNDCKTAYLSK